MVMKKVIRKFIVAPIMAALLQITLRSYGYT